MAGGEDSAGLGGARSGYGVDDSGIINLLLINKWVYEKMRAVFLCLFRLTQQSETAVFNKLDLCR
jgi:hypothetical protein